MKVCIVGGGLAGLAFAVALSNGFEENVDDESCIEIWVIEKHDFTSRGATFGLALNGQVSLQEICPTLLEELKLIGIPLSTGAYMLPWYKVRDGLLDNARQVPNVKILSETSVISIEERNNKVHIILEPTSSDHSTINKQQELIVDLLIGADGVNSTIRTLVGAPPALSSKVKCWRGAINELPTESKYILDIDIAKTFYSENGIFAIFNFNSTFEGFISWVATSKNLHVTTPYEVLDSYVNPEERKIMKELLDVSTKEELEFSTILSTTHMDDEIGWGGKGLVTLIGDAAHALRPASGLGGSLALEDAAILARELIKGKQNNTFDINTILRHFETIRFTRCKTIVDDQTRIAESAYSKYPRDPKQFEWTEEYRQWLFTGPDADPNPPPQIYIREKGNKMVKTRITTSTVASSSFLAIIIGMIMLLIPLNAVVVQAQQQMDPLTVNGGSLLAMAGEKCVALAVDKRFGSGAQMVNIAPRHVWVPHPNVMLGFVGFDGDVRSLSEDLKIEVAAKRNRALGFGIDKSERRISPPALASVTSHVLYERRGYYYVEPLVVGLMEGSHQPFLCAMDMIGAQSFSKSFVCSGAAQTSIYGTAEALWKPRMKPEELAEICGKAFQSALERDCLSGYGIIVYLITKDGIREYELASRND